MSYGFQMNFKNLPNGMADAIPFAQSIADAVYGNLRSVLEEERYWIPSVRFSDVAELPKMARDEINMAWLESLLKLNFIWFKNFNLIALSGRYEGANIGEMFDAQVYFQDSCDQDYDFKTWEGLDEPFSSIVKLCGNADYETLFGCTDVSGCPSIKDFNNHQDYYRRSAAYQRIFEVLNLNEWLYDRYCENFIRFSISALNSQEKCHDANILLKKIAYSNYN